METASSSSESSDDASSFSSSISLEQNNRIQRLEDLPSDDSVSIDSSDIDTSNNHQHDDDSDDSDQEMTLEDRLSKRRTKANPATLKASRKEQSRRKTEAIAKAREKLSSLKQQERKKRKVSKHAPKQLSSTRKQFFQRGAPRLSSSGTGIEIEKQYKARDPRFADGSGNVMDPNKANQNYSFLQDMLANDIQTLQRRIMARQTTGKKGNRMRKNLGIMKTTLQEDKDQLQRLKQQVALHKQSTVDRAAKRAVKKRIRDQGGAYYPKKRDLKQMEQQARMEELKRVGGQAAVDKAMAKRRKKEAAKSKKELQWH